MIDDYQLYVVLKFTVMYSRCRCNNIPVCEWGESIPRWPSSGLRTGEKVVALETETVGGLSVLSFRMSWCTGGGPDIQNKNSLTLNIFFKFRKLNQRLYYFKFSFYFCSRTNFILQRETFFLTDTSLFSWDVMSNDLNNE